MSMLHSAGAESVAMLTHKPINSSSSICGMHAHTQRTRRAATQNELCALCQTFWQHTQRKRYSYRYDYTATDTATLHIHTYRYIYTATDTNKLTADTTELLQIQLQPLHTAIDTHTPTKHSYRYIYSYIHTSTYTILGHSRNAAERRPLSGLPYHFIRP